MPNDYAETAEDTARIAEIRRVLAMLFADLRKGEYAELRTLLHGQSSPGIGFFNDLDALAQYALAHDEQGHAVYVGLNPRNDEARQRQQWPILCTNKTAERTLGGGEEHTTRRQWLFLDCDPERQGTCCSTEEEKRAAKQVLAGAVAWLCKEQHWPAPTIVADSGNGYHAVWRIDLPADDGGLVRRVLEALHASVVSLK